MLLEQGNIAVGSSKPEANLSSEIGFMNRRLEFEI